MTVSDIKADIKSKTNVSPVEEQKPQVTPEQIKDHNETFGFNKVIPPSQQETVEQPKSETVNPQENGVALLQALLKTST
jgi:hypothetical protein